MTIAIGRCGRDSGLTLYSPRSWSVHGDEVEIAGDLVGATYAKLVILRAQFAGLRDNPDEPAVGVSWTGDSSVDGHYEVLDAEVPMPPRGLAARRLGYRARLRRIAVAPDLNSLMVGNAVRTNDHSIGKGSTVPWWGVPDDATQDYIPSASSATRVSETGTVRIWYRDDGTILYNRVNRWTAPAGDYYDGAARIEITDGSAWYAVVGRRLPNVSVAAGWRVTNGLVRVSGGGGDGLIKVEHYVGGSWSVSKTYKLTVTTTPTTIGAFRTITVTRNSPEVCSVRIGLDQENGSVPAAVTLDLSIRRGALWVEGLMSRTAEIVSYLGNQMGLYRNTAEAGTAHTSGIHATAADAQGGKYIISTVHSKTNDLTQGGFYVSSALNEFDFMIGYEPGSPTGPDTFTNQVFAYFGPLDETVGFARR